MAIHSAESGKTSLKDDATHRVAIRAMADDFTVRVKSILQTNCVRESDPNALGIIATNVAHTPVSSSCFVTPSLAFFHQSILYLQL